MNDDERDGVSALGAMVGVVYRLVPILWDIYLDQVLLELTVDLSLATTW